MIVGRGGLRRAHCRMPPESAEALLAPSHQLRALPTKVTHSVFQTPIVVVGLANLEAYRDQLARRHPLLPAHELAGDTRQNLVPVIGFSGHRIEHLAELPMNQVTIR